MLCLCIEYNIWQISLHNPNPRTIVSMHGTQKCYHISHATIPIPILILTYLIRLLRIPPLPVLSSKPRPQEFSLVQQFNSRLGVRAFTSSSHPGCIFTIMNKCQQLRSSYCCTHLTIVTIVKFCYHSTWLRSVWKNIHFTWKFKEEIGDYIII